MPTFIKVNYEGKKYYVETGEIAAVMQGDNDREMGEDSVQPFSSAIFIKGMAGFHVDCDETPGQVMKMIEEAVSSRDEWAVGETRAFKKS